MGSVLHQTNIRAVRGVTLNLPVRNSMNIALTYHIEASLSGLATFFVRYGHSQLADCNFIWVGDGGNSSYRCSDASSVTEGGISSES